MTCPMPFLFRGSMLHWLQAAAPLAGGRDQAAPLEAARLELWRQWSRKLPDNPFVGRQLEAARLP